MNFDNADYEVEIRCRFDNMAEASGFLPFLVPVLKEHCAWKTTVHGLSFFQSGRLLRTARVSDSEGPHYFVGWKGPDTGTFANIRQEVDEEITPKMTSRILKYLWGNGDVSTPEDVARELEQLGYPGFMSFEGEDNAGYFGPHEIYLKEMNCKGLPWPLIIEIEKKAHSAAEAIRCQDDLQALSRQYHLEDHLVRDEPPTLLYRTLFSR